MKTRQPAVFTLFQQRPPLSRVHEQWPLVLLLITSGGVKPAENEIFDKGHFLPKPYTGDDAVREIDDLAREADARGRSSAPN